MRETQRAKRRHLLLTKEIERKIPAIGSTEEDGDDAMVHLKFFCPYSGQKWYITEFDPTTGEMFGLCVGNESELGYLSFQEIEETTADLTFGGRAATVPAIERDCWWNAITLGQCRQIAGAAR